MKRTLLILLLTVGTVLSLTVVLTAYAGYFNPTSHSGLATLGIVFPYLIIPEVVLLLLLLAFRRRWWLLPLGTLVAVLPAIRTTFPINLRSAPPADAVKVMTWNVWLFDTWDYPDYTDNAILRYICDSQADIVCVQEAMFQPHDSAKLMQPLHEVYPYHNITRENHGGSQLLLLSKYPILRTQVIPYESYANISLAYDLLIDGDTVLVVNNHFETNSITSDDRDMMQQMTGSTSLRAQGKGTLALHLYHKLAAATEARAPQARAVAQFIKDSRRKYVIVCGDFNDHPLSYTYHTVARGLTDCYVATANGKGNTYEHSNINLRIDHLLCSKSFKPYAAKVDDNMACSDHYPMMCWLKKDK